MPYGYNGKILRVDLSSGKVEIEQPSPLFYRGYLGGRGFAGYYLLKELPPGIDPLGRHNLLIFASNALSGVPVPGLSRFTVAAKSPLTGGYGESEAGGWWGPELKRAGFDAVLVSGRAPHPVYLWIHDGDIEIKDASDLWGLETGEAQETIRTKLGDDRIRALLIGPGGERQVRYACVVNELRHVNGRTGMGAVMGSKNLKGIAVRGRGRVAVKDPARVRRIARWFANEFMNNPLSRGLSQGGTPASLIALNTAGALPTRNFHCGSFEHAEAIDWETYQRQIFSKSGTCFACPVACKRKVKVDGRYEVDGRYGGPEYETLAAFGSNCGIGDLLAIAKANELCNRYGLDTISTGATIAFAMECYEEGLLLDEETDGLELRFGNAAAMVRLVEMIAHREGIGDLLAEGVKRASQEIGPDAEPFALHVKGQELPMHEPRNKFGVGLGYAVSNTGADHLVVPFDTLFETRRSYSLASLAPLGILEPVGALDTGFRKVRLFYYAENIYSLWNTAGACLFVCAPRSMLPLNRFVELVQAITGWETSLWELLKIGERATNLARAFNVREGFTRKDDALPVRFFSALEGGELEGVSIYEEKFEEALTLLYQMKGWDPPTGRPTRAKLDELGIGWVMALMGEG